MGSRPGVALLLLQLLLAGLLLLELLHSAEAQQRRSSRRQQATPDADAADDSQQVFTVGADPASDPGARRGGGVSRRGRLPSGKADQEVAPPATSQHSRAEAIRSRSRQPPAPAPTAPAATAPGPGRRRAPDRRRPATDLPVEQPQPPEVSPRAEGARRPPNARSRRPSSSVEGRGGRSLGDGGYIVGEPTPSASSASAATAAAPTSAPTFRRRPVTEGRRNVGDIESERRTPEGSEETAARRGKQSFRTRPPSAPPVNQGTEIPASAPAPVFRPRAGQAGRRPGASRGYQSTESAPGVKAKPLLETATTPHIPEPSTSLKHDSSLSRQHRFRPRNKDGNVESNPEKEADKVNESDNYPDAFKARINSNSPGRPPKPLVLLSRSRVQPQQTGKTTKLNPVPHRGSVGFRAGLRTLPQLDPQANALDDASDEEGDAPSPSPAPVPVTPHRYPAHRHQSFQSSREADDDPPPVPVQDEDPVVTPHRILASRPSSGSHRFGSQSRRVPLPQPALPLPLSLDPVSETPQVTARTPSHRFRPITSSTVPPPSTTPFVRSFSPRSRTREPDPTEPPASQSPPISRNKYTRRPSGPGSPGLSRLSIVPRASTPAPTEASAARTLALRARPDIHIKPTDTEPKQRYKLYAAKGRPNKLLHPHHQDERTNEALETMLTLIESSSAPTSSAEEVASSPIPVTDTAPSPIPSPIPSPSSSSSPSQSSSPSPSPTVTSTPGEAETPSSPNRPLIRGFDSRARPAYVPVRRASAKTRSTLELGPSPTSASRFSARFTAPRGNRRGLSTAASQKTETVYTGSDIETPTTPTKSFSSTVVPRHRFSSRFKSDNYILAAVALPPPPNPLNFEVDDEEENTEETTATTDVPSGSTESSLPTTTDFIHTSPDYDLPSSTFPSELESPTTMADSENNEVITFNSITESSNRDIRNDTDGIVTEHTTIASTSYFQNFNEQLNFSPKSSDEIYERDKVSAEIKDANNVRHSLATGSAGSEKLEFESTTFYTTEHYVTQHPTTLCENCKSEYYTYSSDSESSQYEAFPQNTSTPKTTATESTSLFNTERYLETTLSPSTLADLPSQFIAETENQETPMSKGSTQPTYTNPATIYWMNKFDVFKSITKAEDIVTAVQEYTDNMVNISSKHEGQLATKKDEMTSEIQSTTSFGLNLRLEFPTTSENPTSEEAGGSTIFEIRTEPMYDQDKAEKYSTQYSYKEIASEKIGHSTKPLKEKKLIVDSATEEYQEKTVITESNEMYGTTTFMADTFTFHPLVDSLESSPEEFTTTTLNPIGTAMDKITLNTSDFENSNPVNITEEIEKLTLKNNQTAPILKTVQVSNAVSNLSNYINHSPHSKTTGEVYSANSHASQNPDNSSTELLPDIVHIETNELNESSTYSLLMDVEYPNQSTNQQEPVVSTTPASAPLVDTALSFLTHSYPLEWLLTPTLSPAYSLSTENLQHSMIDSTDFTFPVTKVLTLDDSSMGTTLSVDAQSMLPTDQSEAPVRETNTAAPVLEITQRSPQDGATGERDTIPSVSKSTSVPQTDSLDTNLSRYDSSVLPSTTVASTKLDQTKLIPVSQLPSFLNVTLTTIQTIPSTAAPSTTASSSLTGSSTHTQKPVVTTKKPQQSPSKTTPNATTRKPNRTTQRAPPKNKSATTTRKPTVAPAKSSSKGVAKQSAAATLSATATLTTPKTATQTTPPSTTTTTIMTSSTTSVEPTSTEITLVTEAPVLEIVGRSLVRELESFSEKNETESLLATTMESVIGETTFVFKPQAVASTSTTLFAFTNTSTTVAPSTTNSNLTNTLEDATSIKPQTTSLDIMTTQQPNNTSIASLSVKSTELENTTPASLVTTSNTVSFTSPRSTTHATTVNSTKAPIKTTTQKSASTKKPQNTSVKPRQVTTSRPPAKTTKKPAANTTKKPAATTTKNQAAATTKKPAATTTKKSAAATTKKPATTITKKPAATTTRKPVTTTRKAAIMPATIKPSSTSTIANTPSPVSSLLTSLATSLPTFSTPIMPTNQTTSPTFMTVTDSPASPTPRREIGNVTSAIKNILNDIKTAEGVDGEEIRDQKEPVTTPQGITRVDSDNTSHENSKSYTTSSTMQTSTASSTAPKNTTPRKSPPTTTKKPVSTTKRPATTSKTPLMTSKRPVTTSKRPVTTSKRPVTTSKRPVTTSKRPVTTSQNPSTAKPSTTKKITTKSSTIQATSTTTSTTQPGTTPPFYSSLPTSTEPTATLVNKLILFSGAQLETSRDILSTTTGKPVFYTPPTPRGKALDISDQNITNDNMVQSEYVPRFQDRIPIAPKGSASSTSTSSSASILDITSSTSTPSTASTLDIISTISSLTPDSITDTSSTTSASSPTISPQSADKDYVVFGIYPNNTVVRKNPNIEDVFASPFVIFGIYPNNTIVRKFPNGTVIPEGIAQANEISEDDLAEFENLGLLRSSTASTTLTVGTSTISPSEDLNSVYSNTDAPFTADGPRISSPAPVASPSPRGRALAINEPEESTKKVMLVFANQVTVADINKATSSSTNPSVPKTTVKSSSSTTTRSRDPNTTSVESVTAPTNVTHSKGAKATELVIQNNIRDVSGRSSVVEETKPALSPVNLTVSSPQQSTTLKAVSSSNLARSDGTTKPSVPSRVPVTTPQTMKTMYVPQKSTAKPSPSTPSQATQPRMKSTTKRATEKAVTTSRTTTVRSSTSTTRSTQRTTPKTATTPRNQASSTIKNSVTSSTSLSTSTVSLATSGQPASSSSVLPQSTESDRMGKQLSPPPSLPITTARTTQSLEARKTTTRRATSTTNSSTVKTTVTAIATPADNPSTARTHVQKVTKEIPMLPEDFSFLNNLIEMERQAALAATRERQSKGSDTLVNRIVQVALERALTPTTPPTRDNVDPDVLTTLMMAARTASTTTRAPVTTSRSTLAATRATSTSKAITASRTSAATTSSSTPASTKASRTPAATTISSTFAVSTISTTSTSPTTKADGPLDIALEVPVEPAVESQSAASLSRPGGGGGGKISLWVVPQGDVEADTQLPPVSPAYDSHIHPMTDDALLASIMSLAGMTADEDWDGSPVESPSEGDPLNERPAKPQASPGRMPGRMPGRRPRPGPIPSPSPHAHSEQDAALFAALLASGYPRSTLSQSLPPSQLGKAGGSGTIVTGEDKEKLAAMLAAVLVARLRAGGGTLDPTLTLRQAQSLLTNGDGISAAAKPAKPARPHSSTQSAAADAALLSALLGAGGGHGLGGPFGGRPVSSTEQTLRDQLLIAELLRAGQQQPSTRPRSGTSSTTPGRPTPSPQDGVAAPTESSSNAASSVTKRQKKRPASTTPQPTDFRGLFGSLRDPPRSTSSQVDDSTRDQPLVSAAINVTRAVSQFMGLVIQGAAQSFQSFVRTRTNGLASLFTNWGAGSG